MKISVVIPVRDDAAMLAECLAALAGQSRAPDEVVVVDNGSYDDSGEVARRFGARVVYEPERGIWAAAATGFDAASGDLLARCDADSRPGVDWIERLERAMAANPAAVAVTGPGRFYDLALPWRLLADLLYMRAYFWSTHGALANTPLFGSDFAIRASTWRQVRGEVHRHDPEVHDDLDLSYHLDPAWTVLYDRRIAVGISARPLRDAAGMRRRVRRAVHTIRIHGAEGRPTPRWRRRILGRSQ